MDFAIVMNSGQAAMTFDKATDIFNNVYLSLAVRKGSFFARPEFGSRLYLLKKNTQRAERLAEEYAREALLWLLDTDRATAIEIAAQRDRQQDLQRMKLLIEVTQADGRQVSFEYFTEVV